ncbi:YfjI family protein [Scandinavium goeteborgense]|uniref:YfjI family protein n=1 Tax=Scandinavium goeteborgense TaxID=1851514 RepID=UPI002166943F|nr:YfjI family protein [Scandinavium goeteborgense]MCS2153226.1 YfjI family protein [Scandinavium goeteborgense]
MQDKSLVESYYDKDNGDWFLDIYKELYGLTKAPDDLIKSTMLAAMSLACQDLVQVDIPFMGVKPCALYFLTITESGGRKSSVSNQVMKPFVDIDEERRVRYEKEKELFDEKLKDWESALKFLKKNKHQALLKSKGNDKSNIDAVIRSHRKTKPQKPERQRIIYRNTDNSFIGLLEDISNHTKSTGLIYDEAIIFFTKVESEDLAFFNKIWDGEAYERNRGNSKKIRIDDLKLTTLLMIQNGVIDKFLKSKTGETVRDSGFLARFLISKPASNKGNRQIDDGITQSREKLEQFHERISSLLKQTAFSTQKGKITTLAFSPDARKAFIETYNNAEKMHLDKYISNNYGDFLDRFMENVGRLSGIFHFFRYGTEKPQISEGTVQTAIAIINVFFRGLQNSGLPPKPEQTPEDDALKVFKWMLDNFLKVSNSFDKTFFQRKGVSERLRRKPALEPALEILRANNLITWAIITYHPNRKSTEIHRLSPTVLSLLRNNSIPFVLNWARQTIMNNDNCLRLGGPRENG